ncbi:MAG: hypothetical protein ACQES2_03090 [Pseudomonadota bacterium]
MGQLARDGAPQLALAMLDRAQPGADDNIGGWMFFERQRIAILRDWQQWRELALRLESLPDNAPADFVHWATLQRADAYLALGQSDWALSTLRDLIWRGESVPREADLALYQRLIVRAYLQQGRLEDARRGLIRYRGDEPAWALLRARVALRSGRPEAALQALEALEGEAVSVLRALARLRRGDAPGEILETADGALARLADEEEPGPARQRWQWVRVEALAALGRRAEQLAASEQLLQWTTAVDDGLFAYRAEDLWRDYLDLGLAEGNRRQLLAGDANGWMSAAEQLESEAMRRAFQVVTAEHAHSADVRELALLDFDDALADSEDGDDLRWQLWTHAEPVARGTPLPASLRYRLVNLALARQDMKRAAELVAGLDEAPDSVSDFQWRLQRARVLIMAGRADAGADELDELLRQREELDPEKVDQLLQVVFDLQSVAAHQRAIDLLQRLLKRPLPPKMQRELLFWLADSWRAEEDTNRAAAYYLRSATLVDGVGNDPWGQTARYRAAEVLLEAGFYDDAERLFERLLAVTAEAGRRAMIRNQLQSVQLKRNHSKLSETP